MIFFTIAFSLFSCNERGKKINMSNEKSSISALSLNLQKKIIIFINREDSATNFRNTYDKYKSIRIDLYKNKDLCYVSIASYFNSYSSKTITGYLNYSNKILTFYSRKNVCYDNLIDWKKLKTGKIEELTDDDYADWKEKYPLPPPPPREIFRREYLIANNDSLQLVYEGY